MIYHFPLFFLAAGIVLVSADFISELKSQNFTAIIPEEPLYANASVAFNLRFTFQPAAIAYPRSANDVSTIVKIGAKYQKKFSARSGGHSYIANGLGGTDGVLVIDLSNFSNITVDPSTFLATIGPGARLGDIALALNAAGRAMPHGTCPYVGMGGHSGHGGYGLSSRMWGLTLDTIEALEVVLADGKMVVASKNNYPDLFWALRGVSSSFGIVTSIQARTFPVPSATTTVSIRWELNVSSATTSLSSYQSYVSEPSSNIPSNFGPELVFHPGATRGEVILILLAGWYGPESAPESTPAFNETYQSLLSALKIPADIQPISNRVTSGTYIQSVQSLGGLGRLNTTGIADTHDTFYAKSLVIPNGQGQNNVPKSDGGLNADAIQSFVSYLATDGFDAVASTGMTWFVDIELYGGSGSAISAVSLDDTSFTHRDALFTMQFYASAMGLVPPFPEQGFTVLDGMVQSIIGSSSPSQQGKFGAYLNYIDDKLTDWRESYYGIHYPKLESLKGIYDPKNAFRFPTSVEE